MSDDHVRPASFDMRSTRLERVAASLRRGWALVSSGSWLYLLPIVLLVGCAAPVPLTPQEQLEEIRREQLRHRVAERRALAANWDTMLETRRRAERRRNR